MTLTISEERDEIHSKFSSAILEMQQKSGLKYMILEKKITAMREELDIKEAQLYATTSPENVSRAPSIHEVRDVVKEQNERIRALGMVSYKMSNLFGPKIHQKIQNFYRFSVLLYLCNYIAIFEVISFQKW